MNEVSKSKRYIIYGLVVTLILCIGFSVAYFSVRIVGEGKKITVKSGRLSVIFTDDTQIAAENIRFGWSTSKTFSVENQSNREFYYDINIKDLVNTFETEGYLQYKITSDNGGYNMSDYAPIPKSPEASKFNLTKGVIIGGGVTQNYTIEFRYIEDLDVDQSGDMGKTFTGVLSIEEANEVSFYNKLLVDHSTILTRSSFGRFTDSNTKTLYTVDGNWTEGGKTVYYFAGNAKDNWIKFGKDSSGNDLYWRIIRTNEDGSVRLLYVGTSMDTTEGYIATSAYNSSNNNPMYVGYRYGSSGSLANNRNNTTSSPIKSTIDTWYNGSLNAKNDASGNKYDKYVSRTAIYCNDRAHEGTYTTGNATFSYATYYRVAIGKQPSYKCGNQSNGSLYTGINGTDNADRFSASTSTTYTNGVSVGNGKLEYPVALITADEVAFAGGVYGSNAPTWHYYNSTGESVTGEKNWWTMSPSSWSGSSSFVWFVYGSTGPGGLLSNSINTAHAVRPVLSLKSCTMWSNGDGSVEKPYEVTINEACANRDN